MTFKERNNYRCKMLNTTNAVCVTVTMIGAHYTTLEVCLQSMKYLNIFLMLYNSEFR